MLQPSPNGRTPLTTPGLTWASWSTPVLRCLKLLASCTSTSTIARMFSAESWRSHTPCPTNLDAMPDQFPLCRENTRTSSKTFRDFTAKCRQSKPSRPNFKMPMPATRPWKSQTARGKLFALGSSFKLRVTAERRSCTTPTTSSGSSPWFVIWCSGWTTWWGRWRPPRSPEMLAELSSSWTTTR